MDNLTTPSLTLYTRWVEVKLADGWIIKGDKGPTLVEEGQPKPKVRPEIVESWIRRCAVYGSPVVKVAFRYRRR